MGFGLFSVFGGSRLKGASGVLEKKKTPNKTNLRGRKGNMEAEKS